MASPTKRSEERRSSVAVYVRVRPFLEGQRTVSCVDTVPGAEQIVLTHKNEKPKAFSFDGILGPHVDQEFVYDTCVRPLLAETIAGFNATVLAYGQTGSGKTYTMGTGATDSVPDANLGIAPRVATDMFHSLQELRAQYGDDYDFALHATYVEIYQEQIRDLILPAQTATGSDLQIREGKDGSINLCGAHEEPCNGEIDILRVVELGAKSRTTGDTRMNDHSSRSHAIFSLSLEQRYRRGERQIEIRQSKFHLVDLAGSERQKRTGAEGVRLKESVKINSGLLALGNVISALGLSDRASASLDRHVPYRESKLTRMLQDSLGGNSKTVMIAPLYEDYAETLNTLVYANRAKNIKNKPVTSQNIIEAPEPSPQEEAVPSIEVVDEVGPIARLVPVRPLGTLTSDLHSQLETAQQTINQIMQQIATQQHGGGNQLDVDALLGHLHSFLEARSEEAYAYLTNVLRCQGFELSGGLHFLPPIAAAATGPAPSPAASAAGSTHSLPFLSYPHSANAPRPPSAERPASVLSNRSHGRRALRPSMSTLSLSDGSASQAPLEESQAQVRRLEHDAHARDHEIEKLVYQLNACQGELMHKSAAVEALTRSMQTLDMDLVNRTRELEECRASNAHLAEALARSEESLMHSHSSLNDLRKASQVARDDVQMELETLQQQNAQQLQYIDELARASEQLEVNLEQAQRTIADLERSQDLEKLRERQESRCAMLANIDSELESKLSEIKEIEKDQRRSVSSSVALHYRLTVNFLGRYHKIANKFSDKITQLEQELSQAAKEVEVLRSQRVETDAEHSKLKQEYEQRIITIQSQMDTLKRKQREYEKSAKSRDAPEKKLSELKSEIERLTVQQAAHRKKIKEDAEKLQSVEGLKNKEVAQLQKRLDESHRRIKQLENSLSAQRKKLDKQAEHQLGSGSVTRAESGKERQQDDVKLQQTIDMLQADNGKLREMIDALEQTAQASTASFESQIRDVRLEYESQIRRLSSRTPKVDAEGMVSSEKHRELKLKLRELVATNTKLASALDAEQQKNQAFMEVAMQLEEQNAAFKAHHGRRSSGDELHSMVYASSRSKDAPEQVIPKPPTVPPNAYSLFIKERGAKQKGNPNLIKELAEQWRGLSYSEKQTYQNAYARAKEQQQEALREWESTYDAKAYQRQVLRQKLSNMDARLKKRPSTGPKQPSSAWIYFMQYMWKEAGDNTPAKATDMSQMAAERWKSMSEREKEDRQSTIDTLTDNNAQAIEALQELRDQLRLERERSGGVRLQLELRIKELEQQQGHLALLNPPSAPDMRKTVVDAATSPQIEAQRHAKLRSLELLASTLLLDDGGGDYRVLGCANRDAA
ncbi:hypothetical protein RI367_003025 [Sorochytrium milnesiophthora]